MSAAKHHVMLVLLDPKARVMDRLHTMLLVGVVVDEDVGSRAEYRSDSALSANRKRCQCTARDTVFLRKRREPR